MLAALALVACMNLPAPISEAFMCGTATCHGSELCLDEVWKDGGGSADPIRNYSCLAPPSNCALDDCGGISGPICPPCIASTCPSGPVSYDHTQRTVFCGSTTIVCAQ
jgi:hypothetical protein